MLSDRSDRVILHASQKIGRVYRECFLIEMTGLFYMQVKRLEESSESDMVLLHVVEFIFIGQNYMRF